MDKIILPLDGFYGNVFAIVKTLSGTYVCPGWHKVPEGTTREQIAFKEDTTPKKKIEPLREPETKSYEVQVAGSKPGKVYTVKMTTGRWSCTCPAAGFRRGDCKHITIEKNKIK